MKHEAAANLFIIGAPRSGTSFLYEALGRHPEIYAPPVKEPHYYLAGNWFLGGPEEDAYRRPIREYLEGKRSSVWGGMVEDAADYGALYAPGASKRWRLEGTPNYLAEGTPLAEQIAASAGHDARAIAVLRDPVDRIVSHYRLYRQHGWESLAFADAVAAAPERCRSGWAPIWDYIRYSQYERAISEWSAVWGERLKVVSFDDLTWCPNEVVAELECWLGLDVGPAVPASFLNESLNRDGQFHATAEALLAGDSRLDIARERSVVRAAHNPIFVAPLVSVGMPVRNGAATISRALESLLTQSYPNLHIHVCDNASSDETAAIVQEFADADPRVTLHRFQDSVSIKDSYARAMATASGPYFMFSPADDVWAPGFVAAAVGRLQSNPELSVCCGQIELFDDDGSTRLSTGTRPILGRDPDKRWCRALLYSADASRLYGLIRTSALVRLFPDTEPEGWDHYAAAKLALRGEVASIEVLAMRRHQTPALTYRDRIFAQEPDFWGRLFVMRHVARLFRKDPEFNTRSLGARAALWSFVLLRTDLPLLGMRKGWLRAVFRATSGALALTSWILSR